ncbi:MAG: aspartyl-tRNA(Asn)/glutamyl-tRNA(Gln) amidotransferase subunit [Nocardioidaceae bacterium]|nr:aspartyl-tRNA(Asn)/glutamyl-tRNA(Gln) amidotransferase subunit [Nocardioidaceae bacterium]
MADAWQTAADIRTGAVSSVEVVTASLALARDHEVNAFTVLLEEAALAAAAEADALAARGSDLPLLGVPVSVKDHIWMTGVPATNGSLALRDFVPPEDNVAVARLRAAGAVIVGKTNNPEFCYRGYTDNLLYGLTRNPWDLGRTPGGSSGGAGASVAAGMTPLALGTDGGGSIRIPAAFCGVVGHKPTFGAVPKDPGFLGWKTLSVDGPIARSVRDAALMMSVIAGPAVEDDMTYPGLSAVDLLAAVSEGGGLRGLRMAWSEDMGGLPVDQGVRSVFRAAVQVFESLGCTLVEDYPAVPHPTELWNLIACAEGFVSEGPLLAEFAGQMSEGIPELIEAGRDLSAADYIAALHAKASYTRLWGEFFGSYDLLVTPTMQLTAFPVGIQTPEAIDGEPVDPFFDDWCTSCLSANLAGLPATSLPAGFADGLPVGLQIMGPRWSDALTLRGAAAFERVVPWKGFVPPRARAG